MTVKMMLLAAVHLVPICASEPPFQMVQELEELSAGRETMLLWTAAAADSTEGKPSWTAKLLSNPELLCKKVRQLKKQMLIQVVNDTSNSHMHPNCTPL